ncbi:MAG: hypothetical protein R6X20_17680 [Phycisphaerae bacterium]
MRIIRIICVSACLLGAVRGAEPEALVLRGRVGIHLADGTGGPVRLAAEDVARDLGWVLGEAGTFVEARGEAQIRVRVDPAVGSAEAYRITVTPAAVTIVGADALGAIYGLYAFSRDRLGVDPYWFWKDLRPPRREAVHVPQGTTVSAPATVRYRGWFVNDEDLLTAWHDPAANDDRVLRLIPAE